jgi:hypothetical protein
MRTRLTAALAMVISVTPVCSQTIARDVYHEHLPGMGKLVAQTRASERFQLFGDRSSPSYRDADSDGVDDARAELLRDLASRFSPVLRRNNFSGPRDFQHVTGRELWLQQDVWRSGRLVSSDSLVLGRPPSARHRFEGFRARH